MQIVEQESIGKAAKQTGIAMSSKQKYAPRIKNFLENIEFSDRVVDIVGENFDLVIRISELQDSTLIARRLCQTQHLGT